MLLPRDGGAKVLRVGLDADAPQVQSVGIPARTDRGLALDMAIAVEAHGLTEVLEFRGIELDQDSFSPQADCEVSCALAVQRVAVIVVPLAVVQVGEPGDDRGVDVEGLRDAAPVEPDTTPVRDAVNAIVKVQPECGPNDGERLVNDRRFAKRGIRGDVCHRMSVMRVSLTT